MIALFGSRARGDAHEESDIDVCVVVDGLVFSEWREINHIAIDVAEERDAWELSPFRHRAGEARGVDRLIDRETRRFPRRSVRTSVCAAQACVGKRRPASRGRDLAGGASCSRARCSSRW
jgi:hypothetical protein